MAAKAKTKDKKAKKGTPKAPKIKPSIPIEVTFKGQYKERNYGGYTPIDVVAKKVGDTLFITANCQSYTMSCNDLIHIGLLIGREIIIKPPLPKGTKIKASMLTSFDVPYSNEHNSSGKKEQNLRVSFEKTKNGKFVIMDTSNLYRFRVRQETFKEFCEALSKNYKIVEIK